MKLRTSLVMIGVLSCSSAILAQTQVPLPAYDRTYTGNVRGYYFTAPIDFRIVALRVPDETGARLQSLDIVRFDNNTPPPAFSGTTNAFVSLARFVDEPSGERMVVDILINAGEVIGIYGQCLEANSYAVSGTFGSEIFGRPTDLTRSGMQFTLNSGPMQDIWSEAAFNVCRVEMYYVEASSCACACTYDPNGGPSCDIFGFLAFQNDFVNGCL